MAKINDIVEEIKALSVVEVSDLVKLLEEEFGVSAAAPVAVAAAPAAGAAAPAAADAGSADKASYNVILKEVPAAAKIKIIKVVKEATGLGLTEAKALVESAPKAVKENVSPDDAKALEAQLKEAGATVELA